MANNPYVNKVIYGNDTVMDITDTTAEEGDVVTGKTFYKASGARSTGSAVIPDISNCYQTTDTAETAIADNDYFPFYDTSATGKRKTLWSNIKAKLKAYFDGIYSTFSGSYNDLSDKPTIPAAQIQSDWNQTTTTAKDYIKNKPTIYKKGVYYGTCTSQAANQTKAVTIAAAQGFTLEAGATIYVKFDANNTYSATAEAPVKLNVNNTGAKNVYYGGSSTPTGTNTTVFGRTNYINQYIYDGTYWVWTGSSADNNTTYSAMSVSELTTGTATTARSVRADYLKTGINSLIDTKINALDVTGASNIAASKTIKAWSETDGKVSVTTQDIAIASSQVSGLATVATSGDYDDLTGKPDLNDYAPLASPAFTGTPTAPTAASGTNTTQIATTAFVQENKTAVVDGFTSLSRTDALSARCGQYLENNDGHVEQRIITGSGKYRFPYSGYSKYIQTGSIIIPVSEPSSSGAPYKFKSLEVHSTYNSQTGEYEGYAELDIASNLPFNTSVELLIFNVGGFYG